MKLVLKNTDLVFKTQAQLVKCYETTRTANAQGRLDAAVSLATINAGTTVLAVKITKSAGSPTTYALYKNGTATSGTAQVTLNASQPFGEISEAYDYDGYNNMKWYATGFTEGDSFTIEVYKYDM